MLNNQNDTARARFFMNAKQDMKKTEEEGRPIFVEHEMVSIQIPGDSKTEFVDYVYRKGMPNGATFDETNPNHVPPYTIRFAREYEMFKAGQAQAITGTPLEHWPLLTAGRVAELKASKVLSVEDLATVPDGLLPKLGPNARTEREKARAFLQSASDSAVVEKMAREKQDLEDRLKRMEALLASVATTPPAQDAAPPADDGKKEIAIEDATDEQLKAWLKERTGEPVRGNISRATLEARVREHAA